MEYGTLPYMSTPIEVAFGSADTLRCPMPRRARSPEEKKADSVLGRRLAKVRKDRGFTQVELADATGVIQTIISDYERGKLRPNPDMLVKLAQTLQVSTDELLGLTPARTTPAPNRRFLRRLKDIDQLPVRDQEALLRTIDAFLAARKAS
jgi:transcriptional regulator with XRE-family HTH domain